MARQRRHPDQQSPGDFEQQVARLYRELGATVEHNKNLSGLQIDVFAVQQTPDGSAIRTAIECKRLGRPLGVERASEVSARFATLKHHQAIEKGVVISARGFTQDARLLLATNLIECFTPGDLERKVADFTGYLQDACDGIGLPAGYREVLASGSYVSLSAKSENDSTINSIEEFLDSWVSGSGTLLTILGEYGSGKTTTCWKLFQRLAWLHLQTRKTRIPILVELKSFARSFTLRSFLHDLFLNQKGIQLRSYTAFEKLNREGRLLLILDGFDEMATNADPALVFRCLDEILALQDGRAKILLTCRTSFFKDRTDLERLETGTDLHSLLHRHKGYQVLFLQGLTEEQIQYYLSHHYGDAWSEFFTVLERRTELRSIVERPILLNMLVNTVASPDALARVDIGHLYERYTDIWIKRDNWRCHLTPSQRIGISKSLAFELISRGLPHIHHNELQLRLARYFDDISSPEILDQYAYEVRTCSFLRNDLQGFYSFVHRSFAEFFAAQFMLDRLEQGDAETLGAPVSPETIQFLGFRVNVNKSRYLALLWDLLRTPDESQAQGEHRVRAVAAYVLLQCREDLSGIDLSAIDLPKGVDFGGAQLAGASCRQLKATAVRFDDSDLTNVDLAGAQLLKCSFRHTVMAGANLEGAELSGSDLASADLRHAVLSRARLDGAQLTARDVATLAKESRHAELSSGHRQFGKSNEVLVLVSELKERVDKRRLRALLDAVTSWDGKSGVVNLVGSAESLGREIALSGGRIEQRFEERLKRLERERLESEERGEQLFALVRHQQKVRRLRHSQRVIRLKAEYASFALSRLLTQAKAYAAIAAESQMDRSGGAKVTGAVFLYCEGLSNYQREWLERNGAITRPRPEATS